MGCGYSEGCGTQLLSIFKFDLDFEQFSEHQSSLLLICKLRTVDTTVVGHVPGQDYGLAVPSARTGGTSASTTI